MPCFGRVRQPAVARRTEGRRLAAGRARPGRTLRARNSGVPASNRERLIRYMHRSSIAGMVFPVSTALSAWKCVRGRGTRIGRLSMWTRHRARRVRDPSKPGTRGCRRVRARGYAGYPEASGSLQRTHSASARTERSKPASWRCRPRSALTLHPPSPSFSFGQSSCRIPGRHGQRRHPSSARRCAIREGDRSDRQALSHRMSRWHVMRCTIETPFACCNDAHSNHFVTHAHRRRIAGQMNR